MTVRPAGGTAVLVFGKSPRPGEVKTRLVPALTPHEAAALHARLLDRALAQACASRLGPVFLCCAPDASCPVLGALARRRGVGMRTQRGRDLGERMASSLAEALHDHSRALLIGADCPSLDAAVLRAADATLAGGAMVCVVPAHDGGYVLVGARVPCAAAFEAVPWGTSRVLAVTRERLRGAGLSWHELPPLHDIDRPEDLGRLPRYLFPPSCAPKF